MKLVHSNGKVLSVYELSGPVYRVLSNGAPIKYNGYTIMEDNAARDLLRELLALDCYIGERCD